MQLVFPVIDHNYNGSYLTNKTLSQCNQQTAGYYVWNFREQFNTLRNPLIKNNLPEISL